MESEAQATTSTPTPPVNVGLSLLTWLEVNKKRLAYAGVGLVVIIIAVAVFTQHQAGKEDAASNALSDVRMPAHPGLPAEPGTADKLLQVANDFKGTKAAPQALLRSAGILFTEGDFVKAQERFNSLLQDYPESLWVAEAHLGVAASLQAQGKTEDAIKKFEDLRKRYASAPIADDVKLALGRLYQASNAAEAYRLFGELTIAGNPNSPVSAEAAFLQEALVKKNPELAKLREPQVPPAPPSPVQITALTNRPSPGTNRTIALSNLMQRAGTNVMRVVTGAAPAAIQITPAPAAAAPPAGTPAPAPAPTPAPPK